MASQPTFASAGQIDWSAIGEYWQRGWRHRPLQSLGLGSRTAAHALDCVKAEIAITEQRIWLDGLPESFRDFRIVQLSDIHHSLFVPLDHVAAVVEATNLLQPDLIALTGDFVTYSRASIEPVAEILGALRARTGVVAVLGNHDFRVDATRIERALHNNGIDVLRNRHMMLCKDGDTLPIVGVDDYRYGADLNKALHGIPREAATVLLAHNPRLIGLAACHGVSLVLSGHTHGGQINLPLLGSLYGRNAEQLRFKVGWDRLGSTQIYVSRGIGTVVLPWRCAARRRLRVWNCRAIMRRKSRLRRRGCGTALRTASPMLPLENTTSDLNFSPGSGSPGTYLQSLLRSHCPNFRLALRNFAASVLIR